MKNARIDARHDAVINQKLDRMFNWNTFVDLSIPFLRFESIILIANPAN